MLTVNELSKLENTTPDAIRHYVKIGLLTPTRNSNNGYKQFGHADVKKLKFIAHAKALGFTLKDIHTIFDHSENHQSPCPMVRELIQRRIEENKQKIEQLQSLIHQMNNALERWQTMPNGDPDGDAICHLIESIDEEKTGGEL